MKRRVHSPRGLEANKFLYCIWASPCTYLRIPQNFATTHNTHKEVEKSPKSKCLTETLLLVKKAYKSNLNLKTKQTFLL